MSDVNSLPGLRVSIRVEGECLPKHGNAGDVLVKVENDAEWKRPEDISLPAEFAGNLIIIGDDGMPVPLALGYGLYVRDGQVATARPEELVLPAEFAGKLMLVSEDGTLSPLNVGDGLQVRNGTIESPFVFTVDAEGNAVITGGEE